MLKRCPAKMVLNGIKDTTKSSQNNSNHKLAPSWSDIQTWRLKKHKCQCDKSGFHCREQKWNHWKNCLLTKITIFWKMKKVLIELPRSAVLIALFKTAPYLQVSPSVHVSCNFPPSPLLKALFSDHLPELPSSHFSITLFLPSLGSWTPSIMLNFTIYPAYSRLSFASSNV